MKNKKTNPKPKGRIIFFVFISVFCLMIGFFSLYGFFVPDREMSENENRVLASAPVFTFSGLFDGSYMKDIETYLADQFPFRDEAVYIKSFAERLWGKSSENGVYIGKDGFLFDEPTAYSEEKMQSVAKSVSSFIGKNKSLNTVFALVPNSSYIYSEKLPDGLAFPDQKKQIIDFYRSLSGRIAAVNTVAPLLDEKSSNDVFYKTDHHWTTRGAFSVFLEIADMMNLEADREKFDFYTVSTHFEGTLKAKSVSQKSVDSVEICVPEGSEGTYYAAFSGMAEKRASLFFKEKLHQKNNYEVFLGGNYARIDITTTLPEGRKLIVIKDSYANCLIPMLTPYFTRIVVLDPRYMTESVQKILQEDDFTDMLFLYNANTFFADTSLVNVLV